MIVAGYLGAIVMGGVLGLIGGGGSILTVPLLVYLLKVNPVEATGYSLAIVGTAAVFGAWDYYKRGLIDFKTGTVFAIPAFLGVYLVRRYLVPALPDPVFAIGSIEVAKDTLILVVFAIVMLAASVSMIRGRKDRGADPDKKLNIPIVAIEGIVVGGITGFVGAGGGFLIIPALVILAGLEMKVAVGTSLMIIAVKSLLGFTGDLQTLPSIDWTMLGIFIFLAVIGIQAGTRFSRKVSSAQLKPAFGWFVLIMGTGMLVKEVFL
jgi:uncharacterized membrane protein YfcA